MASSQRRNIKTPPHQATATSFAQQAKRREVSVAKGSDEDTHERKTGRQFGVGEYVLFPPNGENGHGLFTT